MFKRTFLMALLCLSVTIAKSQRIDQVADYEYISDQNYATKPVLTLDSVTGYLHYSYIVNYESVRDNMEYGGIYYTVTIVNQSHQAILIPIDFNNETTTVSQLPNGQCVYGGSVYVGHLYSTMNVIAVSYSHGYGFYDDPFGARYASGYQEYYFYNNENSQSTTRTLK